MPRPEENQVRLCGELTDIRQRWTPDGSPAAAALLVISRPASGAARATGESNQPVPLRATGDAARLLAKYEGRTVVIEGKLRRRYYSREGEPRWGQVEVWVDYCRPMPE